jgi:GAF domain-containing protein
MNDRLKTTVLAATLEASETERALLTAIVKTARAMFGAGASSVFVLDEQTYELVFEAVASDEERALVGWRIPASTGIAGWVLNSRQPIAVDDLSSDRKFASDVAESTGYVPTSLMAAPLFHEDEAVGVIEVLDPTRRMRSQLADLDLLAMFANQAAIAIQMVRRNRAVAKALTANGDQPDPLVGVVSAMEGLEGASRQSVTRVLDALAALFREMQGGAGPHRREL